MNTRPGQKSPTITEEELNKLLLDILQQALGKKVDPAEMHQIVEVAKEMLKEAKPGGLTRDDVKRQSTETKDLLKNTLTAATSVVMMMTVQKNKIHQLLDTHKQLMLDLKGIKPGPDSDKEKNKLIQQINGVRKELQDTLKYANKFDNNKDRREAMDKVLDSHDLFEKLEEVEVASDKLNKGAPDDKENEKTLTESLKNLYGMDPRIAGSVASPVVSLIGNEYGIPDNSPTYGSSSIGEGLKVMENEVFSANVENEPRDLEMTIENAKEGMDDTGKDILDQFEEMAEQSIDDSLETNQGMGYGGPPTLSRL